MGIQNYNVFIFRVVSFNAFWNFLWLRNSAWDFYGDKFWSRNFLGFGSQPQSIIPFLKSGVPPGIFETAYFTNLRMDETLNYSGERF